jgi:FdhE protein
VHHVRRSPRASLQGIEGDADIVKAETCPLPGLRKDALSSQSTNVDPFADDLASLGLDILVAEAGFARHAPGALLLIG